MNIYKTISTLKDEPGFLNHGGMRINSNNYELQNPYFSIISVVKNSSISLEKTLMSVFNQTEKNFEYIIIDGNSEDDTKEIIKKYEKNLSYWCSINDNGIYDAMNFGLKLSKGKFIGIINSGDTYTSNALKIVKKYFDNSNEAAFLFGTVKRYYLGNNLIIKHGFNKERIKYNFDSQTCHSSGFFIKNTVQKEIGLYNTNYKCSSDYDLFYKLFTNKKYKGISTTKDELLGEVESGGYSSKYGMLNHAIEEFKIRKDNKQNIFFISLIFINSLVKKFFKKLFN